MTRQNVSEKVKMSYRALFPETEKPSIDDWMRLYYADPPEAVCDIWAPEFTSAFVLGFDLPPFMQKLLDHVGARFVAVNFHPAGFLEDLLLEVSTNSTIIDEYLSANAYPDQYIHLAAAHQIARYTPNAYHFDNRIPENSLLLVPPHLEGVPPVSLDGTYQTLGAFEDDLSQLLTGHSGVFALKGFLPQDETFIETGLGGVILEFDSAPKRPYAFTSSYMLFANSNISAVAGVCGDKLKEATYFGKTVHVMLDTAKIASPFSAHPITKQFFSPLFWQGLFSHCFGEISRIDKKDMELPLPNLRLIFRGGAKDFDDSTSYDTCLKMGKMAWDIRKVQCGVDHASIRWQPPGKESVPQSSFRYSIYSNGDNNVCVQAVVALRSFAMHLGCEDVYYITDESQLSQENKALFKKHNICTIHSEYAKNYEIARLHTSPSVYLQLAAPELMAERGYAFSLGVHVDTLCIKPFSLEDICKNTKYFAGKVAIEARRVSSYADLDVLRSRIETSPELFRQSLMNPGVLFSNNAALAELGFAERAVEVFQKIGKEVLRFNEETLLAYFADVVEDFVYPLGDAYNYTDPPYNLDVHPYVIHYVTAGKPWSYPTLARWDRRMPALCDLFFIWEEAAADILGERYMDFKKGQQGAADSADVLSMASTYQKITGKRE